MKYPISAAIALIAAPALAQDMDGDWAGFYLGGSVGANLPSDQSDRGVTFDTDRNGQYGDTVRTGAGADAFSPGFCGGGCRRR